LGLVRRLVRGASHVDDEADRCRNTAVIHHFPQ
jgi:hypothetical protein